MPSSWNHLIPLVCDVLDERRPKRVLDIGVGYGKYGFLAREYGKSEWVEGIEGDASYITDVQKAVYDLLTVGDIREELESYTPEEYDLVIMADVIEHMSLEDGHRILQYFNRCPILVTTPAHDYPQHDDEHPLENHVSQWAMDEFNRYQNQRIEDPRDLALVVLVNPGAGKVKDGR